MRTPISACPAKKFHTKKSGFLCNAKTENSETDFDILGFYGAEALRHRAVQTDARVLLSHYANRRAEKAVILWTPSA